MPSPDNRANDAPSERNAMKIGYFAIGMGRLANPAWIKTLATTVERFGILDHLGARACCSAQGLCLALSLFRRRFSHAHGDPDRRSLHRVDLRGGLHQPGPSGDGSVPGTRA